MLAPTETELKHAYGRLRRRATRRPPRDHRKDRHAVRALLRCRRWDRVEERVS